MRRFLAILTCVSSCSASAATDLCLADLLPSPRAEIHVYIQQAGLIVPRIVRTPVSTSVYVEGAQSPDGQVVIQARKDGFWAVDLKTGQVLRRLTKYTINVDFKWSEDSRRVLFWWHGDDRPFNAALLWDRRDDSKQFLPILRASEKSITNIYFLGNFVALGYQWSKRLGNGSNFNSSGFEIIDLGSLKVKFSTLRSIADLSWRGFRRVGVVDYKSPAGRITFDRREPEATFLATKRSASRVVTRFASRAGNRMVTVMGDGKVEVFDFRAARLTLKFDISSLLGLGKHEWLKAFDGVFADDDNRFYGLAVISGDYHAFGRYGGGQKTTGREHLIAIDLEKASGQTISALLRPADILSSHQVPLEVPFIGGSPYVELADGGRDESIMSHLSRLRENQLMITQTRDYEVLGTAEVFDLPQDSMGRWEQLQLIPQ